MNLDFMADFKDQYLQTPAGQGAFLAGVTLGFIAVNQVENEKNIKNAALFKQIQFGRMDLKTLKKHLARVPNLIAAYSDKIPATHLVSALAGKASSDLLQGEMNDLGVDGNFAFTVGFLNAKRYFWEIFKKKEEV